MKLIYVSSEYSGAVVEGQVYKLLDYYVSKGWFDDVLLLQQYTSCENLRIAEEVLLNHNFRYKLFKARIFNPFKDYKNKIVISKLLNQEINGENYVIHTRTLVMAYHVNKALKIIDKSLPILADERGAIFDELKYSRRKSGIIIYNPIYYIKYFYLRHCYDYTIKNKIQISTVSFKLKELLVKNKFSNSNICVHPNIASDIFKYCDECRCDVRKQLGILSGESLVVLSSGEAGLWQSDNEVIDIILSHNVKILNLGKKKVQKQGVINLFVPHNEMPYYLSAADIAILWREKEILNEVACPSKFGEFAVMGLYIIHNKTVDIATKFLKDNNIGLLVDNVNDIKINNISSYYQLNRQKRIELGNKVFSVEEIAKSYYNKYRILNDH